MAQFNGARHVVLGNDAAKSLCHSRVLVFGSVLVLVGGELSETRRQMPLHWQGDGVIL